MANIKSAIKAARKSQKNRLRNMAVKSSVKTAVKKAETAITNNDEKKDILVKKAVSSLDHAATKKIIHKNTAARKKSRLIGKLNKSLVGT